MGGREVPIHLELNSVASRASHAAIHPTAGSCRSPGDATGGPQPPRGQPRYRGKGKIPRLGQTGERLASTQPSVSLSGWSSWLTGGFLAAASVWALHGGALPGGGAGIDPAPLALAGHGPGCLGCGGLQGEGGGDAGSWLARQEPSERSRWKTREPRTRAGRTLPREKHAREDAEKDRPQLMPKEQYFGEVFSVPRCSDIS